MLYLQGEKSMYLRTCEIYNNVSHLRRVRKFAEVICGPPTFARGQ
jgi:hypothetical protein